MADVSLGIPVYNSSKFLDALFERLRSLDPHPAEIIFLDDASTDNSNALVEAFANAADAPNVRTLRNERNLGIAASYNRLAREARSEWLQILDADDLHVETDFFGRVQPALTADCDVVITGVVSNSRLLDWGSRLLAALVPGHPPLWLPLLGSFATRAGVLYRRQRLVEHPFSEPAYPGSDIVHLLDLRRAGGCRFLRQPRVFYRVHHGAQSSRARDYQTYRAELARFNRSVRVAHGIDLSLRRLGQSWAR
jgi:glycosyltransferase involved in cell wall biosynthesis